MTKFNYDRPFYIVATRTAGEDIFRERTLFDSASLSRTVIDIAEGQVECVHEVFVFNPVEHTSDIVTEMVADFVAHIINTEFDDHGSRPHPALHAFVTTHSEIRIPRARETTFAAA